jgi:hypothetical protein
MFIHKDLELQRNILDEMCVCLHIYVDIHEWAHVSKEKLSEAKAYIQKRNTYLLYFSVLSWIPWQPGISRNRGPFTIYEYSTLLSHLCILFTYPPFILYEGCNLKPQ